MLVIKTRHGTEIRIPDGDVVGISTVDEVTREESVPPHPYLHKEGVQRCQACFHPPTHPSHTP